jgi:hypothetical protein
MGIFSDISISNSVAFNPQANYTTKLPPLSCEVIANFCG